MNKIQLSLYSRLIRTNNMQTTQQLQKPNLVLETLPILDLDHPGSNDPKYRARRDEIVQNAIKFHINKENQIPLVQYTSQEDKVWQHVSTKLDQLHEKHACTLYKEARKIIQLPKDKVPQLRDLNAELQRVSGFRLEPVHGLVSAREFMIKLADKTMLCTQYIRHHSKPEFSPEPDIIHEVFGHVPMFVHPSIIKLNQTIGNAARAANEEQLLWLNRIYWYSVEYGLIQEKDEVKAFGAGLLGGIKDCTNAFSKNAVIKPFAIQNVIATDYNYSFEQPHFFVIPSVQWLQTEVEKLIATF